MKKQTRIMCYLVIVTEASPDYKRPSVYVITKRFHTEPEALAYKQECAEEYIYDHGLLDDDEPPPTKEEMKIMIQRLWDGEYDDTIYSDSYMDNSPLDVEIIQCLCSSTTK
ncbi:hypothetical protein OAV62_01225 [bacterium]|nr:hypothetical protein [bacterium]